MGRIYTVSFDQITVSALQDLFELFFPASTYKALKILRQWLNCSDTTLPASCFLPIRSRILPPTVTNGSGGGTAKIGRTDPGDSVASFTAKCNNTVKATTTNLTPEIVYDDGFQLYQGHEWMYDKPPIIIGGQGQSFVMELLAVPGSFSVKMSGGLEVEESG